MPAAERRGKGDAAAAVVRANDVVKWLDAQLHDLAEFTGLWAGK